MYCFKIFYTLKPSTHIKFNFKKITPTSMYCFKIFYTLNPSTHIKFNFKKLLRHQCIVLKSFTL